MFEIHLVAAWPENAILSKREEAYFDKEKALERQAFWKQHPECLEVSFRTIKTEDDPFKPGMV